MHTNVKIITMTFGKKVTQNQNCFLTQNYCDLFFVEWICVIRCVAPHTPPLIFMCLFEILFFPLLKYLVQKTIKS